MRYRAKILEGTSISEVLVPLATVLAFPAAHEGRALNDAVENGDFGDWEPWVAWHSASHRLGEERDFDTWVSEVEWVRIENAEDELDPSGGEATSDSTVPPSPESSPAPTARGRSSSRSTTSSKPPSGRKSTAK